mmetsp:Transcript_21243/g.82422  ORF Transcript_21243/g.82422 Transcript_21243/m.82422 type:complete len:207 (-) Transcript_21243:634-1254(-)
MVDEVEGLGGEGVELLALLQRLDGDHSVSVAAVHSSGRFREAVGVLVPELSVLVDSVEAVDRHRRILHVHNAASKVLVDRQRVRGVDVGEQLGHVIVAVLCRLVDDNQRRVAKVGVRQHPHNGTEALKEVPEHLGLEEQQGSTGNDGVERNASARPRSGDAKELPEVLVLPLLRLRVEHLRELQVAHAVGECPNGCVAVVGVEGLN